MECVIDSKDEVTDHGIHCRTKYCRIVRRHVEGEPVFYAQIVAEGLPHVKDKNKPGDETVGIDIGPSTIAYVGETTARRSLFKSVKC